MKKFQILGAVSGALVAGSLMLAGPAAAHRGDAGDGSGLSGGGPSSTSAHTATVTSRAAVGSELPLGPVGAAPAA